MNRTCGKNELAQNKVVANESPAQYRTVGF